MDKQIYETLEGEAIAASAPCRLDMGGTLDIATFYYPLAYLHPSTFNIAVDLRTHVSVTPFQKGKVRVSSEGFDACEYPMEALPFDHPLGLIFAIAAHFRIDGIHIHIESASPPRSALGGSSAAAVALIAAFNQLYEKLGRPGIPLDRIPLLAHAIEESVAGIPCGLQDQLAAAYGGVNAWTWRGNGAPEGFIRKALTDTEIQENLGRHLLLAYCGVPHESRNINSRWVKQFLSGKHKAEWVEVVICTNDFIQAFFSADFAQAARLMNRETGIRLKMTPDVLDDTGRRLFGAAVDHHCGARFTGAGGGGCVWALGEAENISGLKSFWEAILSGSPGGMLLNFGVDGAGLQGG